jgi:hypothetical protein
MLVGGSYRTQYLSAAREEASKRLRKLEIEMIAVDR